MHEDILDAIQVEREASDERAVLRNRLAAPGASRVDIEVDSIRPLLGYGWSHPESWGVWTDGQFATLRIPITADRPWRVQLHGRSFPDSGSVRIGHGWGGGPVVYQKLEHTAPLELTMGDGHERNGEPIDLRLHLPDAISPNDAGTSSDERQLGFALTGVSIQAS